MGKLSTIIVRLTEIDRYPELPSNIERVTGESWDSVSSCLGQDTRILLACLDGVPSGLAILGTDVKEATFLYVKRLECVRPAGSSDARRIVAHMVPQIRRQGRDMGFPEIQVEEERPFFIDLLKEHGFREWRRDMVMQLCLKNHREAKPPRGVRVVRIPGDVDRFVKVWNEIVLSATSKESFDDFPPINAQYIRSKLGEPNTVLDPEGWFVAYLHYRACGLVTVDRLGGVGDLMVATWARRKGVGTALLDPALSFLKKRGFEKAEISLREENLPAIRLYTKVGFQAKATRVSLVASTQQTLTPEA